MFKYARAKTQKSPFTKMQNSILNSNSKSITEAIISLHSGTGCFVKAINSMSICGFFKE